MSLTKKNQYNLYNKPNKLTEYNGYANLFMGFLLFNVA